MQDDLCKNKGSYIESRHWENKGVLKRKQVRPQADFCRYQSIRPDNNDWNASRWVFFTLRTGNEFVRMVPNCLTFYLTPKICSYPPLPTPLAYEPFDPFKVVNKTVTVPAAGERPATTKTVIDHMNRSMYFNPLAGGPSTLIEEIEIILDGQRVQINTGGFFSTTNTLNKLFCPEHVRRDSLGHNHILHNELDTMTIYNYYGHGSEDMKGYFKNPHYEYALRELNAASDDNNKPRICPVSGDIDGMLFLSKPKNLGLNSILECDTGKNQHPILPPNTELQIKMRLNYPLVYRLIDTQMSADQYFSHETDTAALPPAADKFANGRFLNFEINDVTLNIEKVRWSKEKIQKNMASGSINFEFDQYLFRARGIDANTTTTKTEHDIPSHVGLVYVMFARSNQLIYDSQGHRSSDFTRFSLPPNMTHIEFKLNGNRILFANGLSLTKTKNHSEKDAKQFYDYLFHRNLTDDDFDSFFPTGKSAKHVIGFKQCFPLDLTPYKLETPSKIEINCSFNPKSPANYYCVMFMPQSVSIHKPSRDSIWHSNATVG